MKFRALITFAFFVMFVPSALSQGERKISYGIFIDNSGSMRGELERLKGVANEFVTRLGKGDRLTIFGFATESSQERSKARGVMGLECAEDKKQLGSQIDGISTIGGLTTFLDAVKFAAETLSSDAKPQCGETNEKILIFLGDGEDRASEIKQKELLDRLKELNVKVFVVGFVDGLDGTGTFLGPSERQKMKEVLKDITSTTNGKVIFPKAKKTSPEIVDELVGAIEGKK